MSWLSVLKVSNLKRGINMLPHYLIEGNNVQEEALKRIVKGAKGADGTMVGGVGYKNFGKSFKASLLEAETASKAAYAANGGSAFGYIKNACRAIPGELAQGWKSGGAKVAADAGKLSKLGGCFKGLGKAIGKRLPFIGTALYALTTLPNIFKATKEGGLVTGLGEVAKNVMSLAGFTVGCVVGNVICPVIGGIIGGLVCGFIADKIAGKSYTEKKAEIEQKALEKAQAQMQAPAYFDTGSTNPFAQGLTPEQQYQLAMMQQQYAKK